MPALAGRRVQEASCTSMLSAVLALHATLWLQVPAERQPYRSQTDLVVLHVTVLQPRSGLVADLPREAFSVYENGQPQTLVFFERADSPASVGLLLDSSTSMMRRREAVVAAGQSFARSAHPQDEMFLIQFNEHVQLGLSDGERFTSDPETLERALDRITARGMTALFDAVVAGLEHLDHATRQKKILIVVSDGGDNASRATLDDVLARALRQDAVIYTISIHDPYDADADPRLLRRLAAATGGEAFFARRVEDVAGIFERIAREIRSGYTLGYIPADAPADGEFRDVRVEVASPGRRRLTVRARSGYVAAAGGGEP
jgi:Ca-activated chloride channel homolog